MAEAVPSRTERNQVVYLPHGGGPWPFVDLGFPRAEVDTLLGYLMGLGKGLPARPRALLVVSAHWEERVPTLTGSARPGLVYDYYGFPPESYRIRWDAPGDPALAARAAELLESAGWRAQIDPHRGFDHGTFVPMKVAFPEADVPTVQLSLVQGLDPETHLAMGRALAPLRDEGVLLVGSGMSYHNLGHFFDGGAEAVSQRFDGWMSEVVADEPESRDAALVAWTRAPGAREAHPREEHLLPLMVVAGAAGRDRGYVAHRQTFLGATISAHHFGS